MQTMDRDAMLAMYRTMLTIRRTEEQLVRSYAKGLIFGACHTYIGEEAVASGVCAHLRADDFIFGTHRGHGHALAKGVRPVELLAELYGRATGVSGGRGGSMHLFKPEVGLMGTNGIVGPSITLAAGAAYTFKLLKTTRVSVAFFGDGAVNNGSFHEGVNLAGAWGLPVVFVNENNSYATEIPYSATSRNPSAVDRARAYGVNAVKVDGNDALEVWKTAGEAVARARSGAGPTLIECVTYRIRPHAEGMRDAGYRTREEVEEWAARDPIKRLRERLASDPGIDARRLDEMEAQALKEIEEAHGEAIAAPMPDPATVCAHLYSEA